MRLTFTIAQRAFIATLLLAVLLSACNLPVQALPEGEQMATTLTPFHPQASEQGENQPVAQWFFSLALPQAFLDGLTSEHAFTTIGSADNAQYVVTVAGEGEVVAEWVYAVVAPFPTIAEEVSSATLQAAWQGDSTGPFAGAPLLMNEYTRQAFGALWGEPGPGAVEVVTADELVDTAWAQQPSWAIVPFEELTPRWKVLAVDGQSPIGKSFDSDSYALTLPITIAHDAIWPAYQDVGMSFPASNREANKLTTVLLTGVTALVRATAWEMERKGISYPAEDVGDVMREADITHISNEVPFAENCPPPDPGQRTLVFCSDASYIELLETLGTDVVELTGDHFNDWTRAAMEYTLEVYRQHGWPYYGGGIDIDEAMQPLRMENNGNRIAFVGCNGKGGGYASATESYPGTWACDYEYMDATIRQLVDEGYTVIVTFQHNEVYQYEPSDTLMRDFGRVAEAGASIVSGSQAHQPHGVEFYTPDTLITYGLGNMFFDQIIFGYDTSHGMMVRHVIYDNRYISAEILPFVFVDYAKPRWLTAEERAEFLSIIFNNSIWQPRAPEGGLQP
ncbi:MAG TPA: CapA family protein [Anaerolineales bacterium]|nr:CapA family protein [Anaerolineales bacterium]HRQ91801.1 CapA family protein [Anaerolineales bacterium]